MSQPVSTPEVIMQPESFMHTAGGINGYCERRGTGPAIVHEAATSAREPLRRVQ